MTWTLLPIQNEAGRPSYMRVVGPQISDATVVVSTSMVAMYEIALQAICDPERASMFSDAYANAGGGLEGARAVAEAALRASGAR